MKQAIGGERDWLDDASEDDVYSSMANSKYGQTVAGGDVPQDANYVFRKDAQEIKSNEEADGYLEQDFINPETKDGATWITNAKVLHHHYTGVPFGEATHKTQMMGDIPPSALPMGIGETAPIANEMQMQETAWTDKDYAEWALEFMGFFNYNLPAMGFQVGKLATLPPYDAEVGMTGGKSGNPYGAMYNLMTMYDKKDITWNGTKRLFKGLITDPTTVAGLGTLGMAFVGRQSVKQASKKGVMSYLKTQLQKNTGKARFALATTEGGLYAGIDGSLRQSVGISADMQNEFSFAKLGQDTLTGMLFGGSLALGATGLSKVSKRTRDFDKIYATADEAQENLVGFLKQSMEGNTIGDSKVVTEITPENVVDAPVKVRKVAENKMSRKGYTDVSEIKDIVRTAVNVDNPADAKEVVALIKKNFGIVEDDGFQLYKGGYFDYKINVKTPEGNVAEIQILSRAMSEAKPRMHQLFEEAREIAPAIESGSASPEVKAQYEELLSESDIIAAKALVQDMDAWGEVYAEMGLDVEQMQMIAEQAMQMAQGAM